MLEIEFVDRSIALAGKAFVLFFPLVIVVAAFMPPASGPLLLDLHDTDPPTRNRGSSARRAGVLLRGRRVPRATGALGLVLTFSSPVRSQSPSNACTCGRGSVPPAGVVSAYTRGCTRLVAALGGPWSAGALSRHRNASTRRCLPRRALAMSTALWWFSARCVVVLGPRPLAGVSASPPALPSGATLSLYALSVTVGMPSVVTANQAQVGLFGFALALTTWPPVRRIVLLGRRLRRPRRPRTPG